MVIEAASTGMLASAAKAAGIKLGKDIATAQVKELSRKLYKKIKKEKNDALIKLIVQALKDAQGEVFSQNDVWLDTEREIVNRDLIEATKDLREGISGASKSVLKAVILGDSDDVDSAIVELLSRDYPSKYAQARKLKIQIAKAFFDKFSILFNSDSFAAARNSLMRTVGAMTLAELQGVHLEQVKIKELLDAIALTAVSWNKETSEQFASLHRAVEESKLQVLTALNSVRTESGVGPSSFEIALKSNLPPGNIYFTGANNTINRLKQHFSQIGANPIGLNGIGGVGKSEIAVQFARMDDRYDSVFFIDATSLDSLNKSLVNLVSGPVSIDNGYSNEEIAEIALSFIRTASKVLLIFDNADRVLTLPRFDEIIAMCSSSNVIVTSRARVNKDYIVGISIECLEESDSILCLMRAVYDNPNLEIRDVSNKELNAARNINNKIKGLPLALLQAGMFASANEMTPERLEKVFNEKWTEVLSASGTSLHGNTVWVTTLMCLEWLQNQHDSGIILPYVCSFMPVEDIPEVLFTNPQYAFYPFFSEGSYELMLQLSIKSGLVIRNKQLHTLWMHDLTKEILREAIRLDNKGRNTDHIELIQLTTSTLVKYLIDIGNFGDALDTIESALAKLEASLSQNDPYIIQMWISKARCLMYEGFLDEALSTQLHAVNLSEDVEGLDVETQMSIESNLGSILGALERGKEAIPHFLKAIELCETSGVDEDKIIILQNNLSLAYHRAEMYSDAIALLRKVVDKSVRLRGSDHPETFTAKHNLGSVYAEVGPLRRAERLEGEALIGRREILGVDHPRTLESEVFYASVLAKMGRSSEVVDALEKVLERSRSLLREGHPLIIENLRILSGVYVDLERYEDAEVLALEGLRSISESRVLGRKSLLKLLVRICLALRKLPEAASYQEAMYQCDVVVFGPFSERALSNLELARALSHACVLVGRGFEMPSDLFDDLINDR